LATITLTLLVNAYHSLFGSFNPTGTSFSNFEQIFSGAPHRGVPDQNDQNVFKVLDDN